MKITIIPGKYSGLTTTQNNKFTYLIRTEISRFRPIRYAGQTKYAPSFVTYVFIHLQKMTANIATMLLEVITLSK